MDTQPAQQNFNQPVIPQESSRPAPKSHVKFGLSVAIIAICLVAAAMAVYWIKSEPTEENLDNVIVQKANISTANWQTYRNEEYGFEMEIPNDWVTATTALFKYSAPYPEMDAEIDFNIIENPYHESLQQIFDDQYNFCIKDKYLSYSCFFYWIFK